MSKSVKILGGAALLLATAAIGGSLISVALAGDNNTSGSNGDDLTDTGAYCQTFLDSFASHLGVSSDALAPAAKAAAIDAVKAAVDAGDLTQDQADAITTRINNWDGTGCGFVGFHLGGKGGHGAVAGIGLMQDMATAMADKLGMEPAAMRGALAGSSLKQVATDQNVNYADVVTAALGAAKTDLDAAVSDGTITQDQADAVYSRLETWLNNGGEFMGPGMGHMGGMHHGGPGFPFFGGDDHQN